MLKILYVSALGERGGVESVLLYTLESIDRSRFLPRVVLLENGPLVEDVRRTSAEIQVVDAGRVRNLRRGSRAVSGLVRIIREAGIQLVHSHNAKAHLYGGLAARIARVPSIYHLHGVPRPAVSRDGVVSLLSAAIPATKTVACSEYVAEEFNVVWPRKAKPQVILNGIVPTTLDDSDAAAIREEFGISQEAPLVLTIGRLQYGKGVHVFLESAAVVLRTRPDARFMVVGGALFGLETDYPERLRRQSESLGLKDVIIFTGHRADVSRFLAAADVVVHSSIAPEAFGIVLLEAMSLGKPVVASDTGGPKEIVRHGETGLLVPPARPDLQAEAILHLLGNRSLVRQMGRAGAARVHDVFLASRMVRELEVLYEQVTRDQR